MKNLYFTSFILLLSQSFMNFSLAQSDFDHIVYKQDCNSSYIKSIEYKEYKESIKQLKIVQEKYGLLYGEEYILLAYNYAKLGKKKKAAKSLKEAWSNLFFDMNIVFESTELDPPAIMKGFKKSHMKIVEEGFENFGKLKTPFSDSLSKVLLKIDSIDQSIRKPPFYGSAGYEEIFIKTDSINLRNFQKLIRTVGFPGERIISNGDTFSSTLLLHSSYYTWFYEEMKEELLEQVRIGNMAPSRYLRWLDRHDYEFYKTIEFGILDIPEKGAYSENEIKEIKAKRLAYGLINHYPIPSKTLQFIRQ